MEDARPRKRRRLRGWAARDLLHAQIRQQARVMQPVTWISLFVVAVAAAFVALVMQPVTWISLFVVAVAAAFVVLVALESLRR